MRVFIFILIVFFTGCKKKLSPELEKALSEEGVVSLTQGEGGDIICAMCGSKDCLLLLDQGERKIEVEVGDTFSYDHSTWKVLYIPESAKGVYIKKIRLFPRIGLIVLKGSLLTKLWA